MLKRVNHAQEDAARFGFEWPNTTNALQQIISECHEVQESMTHNESQERLQEEIGDLISAALSLCRFCGFDTEETLLKATEKFESRMAILKTLTEEQKLSSLNGQSIDFMLDLWKKAKAIHNREKI